MNFPVDRNIGTWSRYNVSSQYVWLIRTRAAAIRRLIAKARGGTPTARKANKSFAKKKAREFIRYAKKTRMKLPAAAFELKSEKMRPAILLDGLVPNRKSMWKPTLDRVGNGIFSSVDLKNFSMLDEPQDTISSLADIASAECTSLDTRINFLDDQCHDIGAYLLLSAAKFDMLSIFSGGQISARVAKVLDAVQLRETLRMKAFSLRDGHKDVWAFPIRKRRPADTSEAQTRHLDVQAREKVVTDLTVELNRWLQEGKRGQLSHDGYRLVSKIVGEGLDNAERHSASSGSEDGSWQIAGFMAKRTSLAGASYYRCHLAFLSIGKTISESMLTASSGTRSKMRSYTARHTSMIGFKRPNFTRENLETIYALQDGVTCKQESERMGKGGTGFQDIIELFNGLAVFQGEYDEAQLAIISGNTCIMLKEPYIHGVAGRSEEREIWFNPENSPTLEPDSNNVMSLPYRLNGTLVTMAFNVVSSEVDDVN